MQYISHYTSPIGNITFAADTKGLSGLWFDGQKYFARGLGKDAAELSTAQNNVPEEVLFISEQTRTWLDTYFSGRIPDFTPPLHITGTPFQTAVWELLLQVPYGQTTTYGALAGQYAQKNGLSSMSAQAVGGAVGQNRISIIIPCHRVLGTDGSLTGYAGGVDKKQYLLKLERS